MDFYNSIKLAATLRGPGEGISPSVV